MAHVQIKQPHPEGGKAQILVDGVDVSHYLLVEPFEIHVGDINKGERSSVTLALAARPLDVDLPDALIHAIELSIDDEGEVQVP